MNTALAPAALVDQPLPGARSCFLCRHSRHSSDAAQLLCTQPRSPTINGIAIADVRKRNAKSTASHTARLCRYYQEEV